MGFVDELKRRNVFRVGLAYAVSAWLVLQVADLVIEHIEAPGWVMDVLFLLVVLGFFIALVIAWVYEVTPEGIRREADVDRAASLTRRTARRLDIITLVAVGLLLGLVAWERWGSVSPGPPGPPVITDPDLAQAPLPPDAASPVAGEGAAGPGGPGPVDTAGEAVRGVAVLPFGSLSDDPADAYFAGGIHEDVLTQVSRIGDLRVISRTSMARIAERGLSIPDIARQLGVTHVLEGSVRRAGERVRVTVQLIDAAEDDHVWAENYDRRLDDIFAIQTEIAEAIATQLAAELSPSERARIATAPTRNFAAYDRVLRVREIEREGLETTYGGRVALLREAVALDPDYVDAWLLLAENTARMVFTRSGSDEGVLREAEALVERIEAGWPGSVEARLSRGHFQYAAQRDFDAALASFLAVEQDLPNQPNVLLWIASSLKRLGRFDEGLAYLDKALLLDPEHPLLYSERAIQQAGAGRYDEILPNLESAARRFPDNPLINAWIGHYTLMFEGDPTVYARYLRTPGGAMSSQRYAIEGFGEAFVFRLVMMEYGLEEALVALEKLRGEDDRWLDMLIDGQAAELLLVSGDAAAARARARVALAHGMEHLETAGFVPGNEPVDRYAQLSYLACLAGDAETAAAFRATTEATRNMNPMFSTTDRYLLAMAEAACGDPAAAWPKLLDAQAPWLNFTERSLALDPVIRYFFGDVPAYRSMVETAGQP